MDSNTRFLLKYQQISIESVTRRIKQLDQSFQQSIAEKEDKTAGMTED